MSVILSLSIFWIAYGFVSLMGFQNIPTKYKGHSWTKNYVRNQGMTWLILGLTWLGFYLVRTLLLREANISTGISVLILIILAAPALIVSILLDKKYKALLSAESDSKSTE